MPTWQEKKSRQEHAHAAGPVIVLYSPFHRRLMVYPHMYIAGTKENQLSSCLHRSLATDMQLADNLPTFPAMAHLRYHMRVILVFRILRCS